jgi:membrane associated rhomboid family serine protease
VIFPIFRGLLPPHLAPATWFLISVNLFVFIVNLPRFLSAQSEMDKVFHDPEFMRTQGAVFSQFVAARPDAYSAFLHKVGGRATAGDSVAQMQMGGYAVRDNEFMTSAEETPFQGDVLAINKWRAEFTELRSIQAKHPTYKWGLSTARPGFPNWMSYQFAHSGFQHLLWNILFLALFGMFLESLIGSSLVVLVYVGSGFAGAGLFANLSGFSHSPLIGASGAVSGLMSCLAVFLWREKARFFFWLLPTPGYFGFRDLPAWLIVIAYLVPDIAGHIASVPDINGMAYSAHIGGALLGAVIGFSVRQGWLAKEDSPPSAEEIW